MKIRHLAIPTVMAATLGVALTVALHIDSEYRRHRDNICLISGAMREYRHTPQLSQQDCYVIYNASKDPFRPEEERMRLTVGLLSGDLYIDHKKDSK